MYHVIHSGIFNPHELFLEYQKNSNYVECERIRNTYVNMLEKLLKERKLSSKVDAYVQKLIL